MKKGMYLKRELFKFQPEGEESQEGNGEGAGNNNGEENKFN